MNHTLRAIAPAVVPEAASLTETEWGEFSAIIADALAQRPAKVRRQVALLAMAIYLVPPAARARVLQALERSSVLLLRRGIWGLRTLIFMGYYARPSAGAAIGYRADARGWAARR